MKNKKTVIAIVILILTIISIVLGTMVLSDVNHSNPHSDWDYVNPEDTHWAWESGGPLNG